MAAMVMSMMAYCMQRMFKDLMQRQHQYSGNDQPPVFMPPPPSMPSSPMPCFSNLGGQHGSDTGGGSRNPGNHGRTMETDDGNAPSDTGPSRPTPASSPTGTHASLPPGTVVTAPPGIQNKTIVVHKGEVFDGKNQTYIGGSSLGDGSQNEHQQPLFIVEDGGSLCNVRMKGGGDGVHFLGSGKMVNCVNEDVSEDAITIDGQGNREHDSRIAGCGPGVSGRPHVEIINCTFNNASDKIVQDNGPADVVMRGCTVNGAGKVFRTNGGHTDINTHLQIENCQFNHVKEAVFRTDAPSAMVNFTNLRTDAPYQVIAPNASQAIGATRIGHKAYSG